MLSISTAIFVTGAMTKVVTDRTNNMESKIENRKDEKTSYIEDSIKLYDVEIENRTTYSEKEVPGIKFKIRNDGKRTLRRIAVTVYFKDQEGNVIAEKSFTPVSNWSIFENTGPLKPGYIWQMNSQDFYRLEGIPDEWQKGSAVARISDIEFAPDEG